VYTHSWPQGLTFSSLHGFELHPKKSVTIGVSVSYSPLESRKTTIAIKGISA
jgi:hypothetical protein